MTGAGVFSRGAGLRREREALPYTNGGGIRLPLKPAELQNNSALQIQFQQILRRIDYDRFRIGVDLCANRLGKRDQYVAARRLHVQEIHPAGVLNLGHSSYFARRTLMLSDDAAPCQISDVVVTRRKRGPLFRPNQHVTVSQPFSLLDGIHARKFQNHSSLMQPGILQRNAFGHLIGVFQEYVFRCLEALWKIRQDIREDFTPPTLRPDDARDGHELVPLFRRYLHPL